VLPEKQQQTHQMRRHIIFGKSNENFGELISLRSIAARYA
jgi:hypothetical protein